MVHFTERHSMKVLFALMLIAVTGCASLGVPDVAPEPEESILWTYEPVSPPPETLPELTETSGLQDFLVYAALNNAGLQAAFLRWKAALERIPQVTALPDPRFSYGYFIQEVETRVGSQEQRAGLSQMFPWFGKLELQGNAAAETARAEERRFEAARLDLYYRVKDSYYEYYYLSQAVAITRENLKLMEYLENVARTGYTAGMAPYADVVRAQVELGRLEDRLRALEDLRKPTVARLNAAMDRPPEAPLPWPPQKPDIRETAAAEEQLLVWLQQNNPELQALEFQAQREKWNAALAQKSFYPDITLGIEAIDTDDAMLAGTPDSGKDPVIATLSFNIPLWWDKYRAQRREALAQYRALRAQRDDRENRLAADLQLALYNFRDAKRKMELYRDTLIPKAEQSLNVTLESYQTGWGTFLDLVDTVRMLLEFQLSYERALANRGQRLAELEMLVGREIPAAAEGGIQGGPAESAEPGEGGIRER